MSESQQPWQWPQAHWQGIVNHVRAGRTLLLDGGTGTELRRRGAAPEAA